MIELRRWAAAGVVTLLAGVLAPAGTGVAEAQTPPPKPSDEIEVTPVSAPDGDGAVDWLIMNERGELAFAAKETNNAFLWKDGETTRINPEETIASPSGISDEGHVVGATWPSASGPGPGTVMPFSWVDGEWEILPTGEAAQGMAHDVNDRGTVVGTILPGTSAFDVGLVAWDDGELIRAPQEAGSSYRPVAINNRNQVAFDAAGGSDPGVRAGIWDIDTGEVTDLGPGTSAEAINDRGMVLGDRARGGDPHAFLWHQGEMTDLGTLGGRTTYSADLNEWGQVVGISSDADGEYHGFVWYRGEMTQLDGLGGPGPGRRTGFPRAINNWGQVVGDSYTSQSQRHAVLWQNGNLADLGELADADMSSNGRDINDRGQIIGVTWEGGSTVGAFLWTVSPLWGYPTASDVAARGRQRSCPGRWPYIWGSSGASCGSEPGSPANVADLRSLTCDQAPSKVGTASEPRGEAHERDTTLDRGRSGSSDGRSPCTSGKRDGRSSDAAGAIQRDRGDLPHRFGR